MFKLVVYRRIPLFASVAPRPSVVPNIDTLEDAEACAEVFMADSEVECVDIMNALTGECLSVSVK